MLQSLWKVYWRLCTFRVGPEVVPSQLIWVFFLILCNLFSSAWIVSAFTQGANFFTHFFTRAILLVVYFLQIGIIFYFKGYPQRLRSVLSAWLGKELIVMLFLFVFLMIHENYSDHSMRDGAEVGGASFLMGFVFLSLYAWNLLIEGFIFARALSVSFFLGLSLALALFMINEWLESSIGKLLM